MDRGLVEEEDVVGGTILHKVEMAKDKSKHQWVLRWYQALMEEYAMSNATTAKNGDITPTIAVKVMAVMEPPGKEQGWCRLDTTLLRTEEVYLIATHIGQWINRYCAMHTSFPWRYHAIQRK